MTYDEMIRDARVWRAKMRHVKRVWEQAQCADAEGWRLSDAGDHTAARDEFRKAQELFLRAYRGAEALREIAASAAAFFRRQHDHRREEAWMGREHEAEHVMNMTRVLAMPPNE